MEKRRLPRILIVTAGYGEGHNSAARGVRDALAGRAEVRVTDLCAEAMPRMFRLTRAAYLWIISRLPRLWKLMYEVSDKRNLAEKPVKGLAPVERFLERLLRDWKHIGLLPQKVLEEGGYKIKGKSSAEEEALVKDVEAVAEAGACAVVVEGVTPHAARQITVHSPIPTLGIGSGAHTCDGDVVVIHDLVGAFPWFVPAFVKPRADVAGSMTAAVREWMKDSYTEPGSISS